MINTNRKVLIFFLLILTFMIYNSSFIVNDSENSLILENKYETLEENNLIHTSSSNVSLIWYHPTGLYVELVDISSDGNYIICASTNYTTNHLVMLFHKSSSKPLWTFNPNGRVISVAISANGDYIVVGTGFDSRMVYLFHKSSSTPLWSYYANEIVFSVAISSDGEHIVAGVKNNMLYLFNKSSSNPVWQTSLGGGVGYVDISSDGNYIIAGCSFSHVFFFERSSKIPLWDYEVNDHLTSVSISNTGNYITIGSRKSLGSNRLFLFEFSNSTPQWDYTSDNPIFAVISGNGEYIAAGASDEILFFENKGTLPIWNYSIQNGGVVSLDISQDGSFLVAGTIGSNLSGGEVLFFNTENSTPIWCYTTANIILSVATSSDGNLATAGGEDENIYLFSRKLEDTKEIISSYDQMLIISILCLVVSFLIPLKHKRIKKK